MKKAAIITLREQIPASIANEPEFVSRVESAFRLFQQQVFNRAQLERTIQQNLSDESKVDLVSAVIDELQLRFDTIDQVQYDLTQGKAEYIRVPVHLWRVGSNNRIDPTKSVECYYESLLVDHLSDIDFDVCVKYRLYKFLESNIAGMIALINDPPLATKILAESFELALMTAQLDIAALIWKHAPDNECKKTLLINHNYRVVVLGNYSENKELSDFVTNCICDIDLHEHLPNPSNYELLVCAASMGNVKQLAGIVEKAKDDPSTLKLLTDNDCIVFVTAVQRGQIEAQEYLVRALSQLSNRGLVTAEVWCRYFDCTAEYGQVQMANSIWQAVDDAMMRNALIKSAFSQACLHLRIGMVKLLLETAERLPNNPIEVDEIKTYCSCQLLEGMLPMANLLFRNVPRVEDRREILSDNDFYVMRALVASSKHETTLVYIVIQSMQLGILDEIPLEALTRALSIVNKMGDEHLVNDLCQSEIDARQELLMAYCADNNINVNNTISTSSYPK